MADLLQPSELPEGFEYPSQFLRLIDLELTKLDPWWVIEGTLLRNRLSGLRERYPSRRLVPFAVRQDNDDIACWDLDRDRVTVVHDFASPGWEQRADYDDVYAWLRAAIEDLTEFD